MRGNGTFTATIYTETTLSSVGGNTLYYFTGVDALTGTEIGTATVTFLLMVFPSGHDDASGTITCASCTIDGVAGAFVIQFESQGTFGGSSVGIAEASGSGGLATFHGVATFSSVTTSTGFAGPYQLEYTL